MKTNDYLNFFTKDSTYLFENPKAKILDGFDKIKISTKYEID